MLESVKSSSKAFAASLAVAASGIALAACSSHGDKPALAAAGDFCTNPAAMPAGFGYPQSEATLAQWTSERNEAAARAHGWGLFAALQTGADGGWVWQSWCTATQAFTAPENGGVGSGSTARSPGHGERPMRTFKLANGLTSGPEPINFPDAPVYAIPAPVAQKYQTSGCILPPSATSPIPTLKSGPRFQNNGDVMVAGVVYNNDAYQSIRNNNLFSAAKLQSLRPGPDQTAQMAQMPEGSVVLKPMLWPVSANGFVALPVWDDLKSDHGVYSGFEIQSQWSRAVAVTATASDLASVAVSYLTKPGVTYLGKPLGPISYAKAQVVNVDKFYNFRPDVASLDVCDQALLDASAYYAYGRMFEQGDYLVLVAMHIMTKEQPSWTFQSAWWSDRPDSGPYAADRPSLPGAKGPWQHYLMTSTYGWSEQPGGSTWPVAYNPYIELAADHPIRTNCQNCHSRAAWPNDGSGYLANKGPGALDMFEYQNNPIFNGLIGVNSLWSISDRVPYTPPPAQKQAPGK